MLASLPALIAVLPLVAQTLAPPPATPAPIVNGDNAAPCAWPSVGFVQFSGAICTGTLIHPRVVLTAAHCGGAQIDSIVFGENGVAPTIRAKIERCEYSPDYDGPSQGDQTDDVAYCLLSEPITEIPYTPVAMGCEWDRVKVGEPAAIVGFGITGEGAGDSGTKRWATSTIFQVDEETVVVGGNRESACSGDSGGPTFVQMEDGTWRQFGIASTARRADCTNGARYGRPDNHVAWIEERTGVDITPCHNPDGTWDASEACEGFFAGDGSGHGGTWTDMCSAIPVGGKSSICGGDNTSYLDEDPPTVAITDPKSKQRFEDDPTELSVALDADDGDGSGIAKVTLEINGSEAGVDNDAPWGFDTLRMPKGVYTFVAVAEDWGGNVTRSASVTIGVAEDVPDGVDETMESGGEDASDDAASEDGGTDSAGQGGGGGGGCSSSLAPPAAALWAVPGVLVFRRRRRR